MLRTSAKAVNKEKLYKIVIAGAPRTGKSSFFTRLLKEEFLEDYKPTSGFSVATKLLEVNNKNLELQIWDASGSFDALERIKRNYKASHAAILFFDLTDKKTLAGLEPFIDALREIAPKCKRYLVGSKSDFGAYDVNRKDAEEFATMHELTYLKEISAKTNDRIKEVVAEIAINLANARPLLKLNFWQRNKANILFGLKTGIAVAIGLAILAPLFWPFIIAIPVIAGATIVTPLVAGVLATVLVGFASSMLLGIGAFLIAWRQDKAILNGSQKQKVTPDSNKLAKEMRIEPVADLANTAYLNTMLNYAASSSSNRMPSTFGLNAANTDDISPVNVDSAVVFSHHSANQSQSNGKEENTRTQLQLAEEWHCKAENVQEGFKPG